MSLGPREVGALKRCLEHPVSFARLSGIKLRKYQRAVAEAVFRSVENRRGDSLVVLFPRQSGKNELQAQLEAYFLLRYSRIGAELVKVSPTWKPQSLNAMRRLERVLETNPLTADSWVKQQGYLYRVGAARQVFLSGAPEANIVGATASLLLQVDEAQDVHIDKFDKDIAPMAASTNATRVFWGTAWTDQTLLARELEAARRLEKQDGRRRAFVVDADRVTAEVPAYGKFVENQVKRLGRDHPMVRTQFFCETLAEGGGLFTAARRAMMVGEHHSLTRPLDGERYALLLDVAGEDSGENEGSALSYPDRDRTALTVVRVLNHGRLPTYETVFRKNWIGVRFTLLYEELLALARYWWAACLVVDATGVGAGLAAFLNAALPGRVIPFTFTTASKSKLGWDFLAQIDSGRYRDHQDSTPQQAQFFEEAAACEYAITPGPERRLAWSVPPGKRSSLGAPLHDDWLISAALCACLDSRPWGGLTPPQIIRAADPLVTMDQNW